MTVYTWMVVLLLLAALLLNGNKKGNIGFILVAFVLLFVVLGLRNVNTAGLDSSGASGSYPVIFQRYGQAAWGTLYSEGGENFNIGFKYLSKGLYELTDGDYQLYIMILMFFVVFSYMRFIKKYSPAPIQSVLYLLGLLYFTLLMDALKQALAMSVLLFAFDAIFEKKPVKFVLLVLLATSFHFPALIFLPAYWLAKMRVDRNYLLLLALILILTYIFRDRILNLMLSAYGGEDVNASLEGVRFLRNKAIIMIVIVVAAVALRPPTEGDAVYNACLVFAGVAIVFQTFCGSNNIFERLADYYFHTAIIFIPLVFERCALKRHALDLGTELMIKELGTPVFCAFAIWRFLSTVNNSWHYSGIQMLWQ